MNKSLALANSWLYSNRLLINIKKSNFIIIGTRHNVANIDNIALRIDDQTLQQCSSTKLLGIHIDQNLTFHNHMHYLITKISNKIALIHRLRQFLPHTALNTIYLTLIQPQIDYCITVWGPFSKTNRTVIQKLQNRCARAVTGIFDYTVSVSGLIKSLGWMTVEERLLYSIATLVYKSLNNLAPTYLSEKFHYVSQCHTYNTRSALCNDLMLPRSNTALFTHSFIYQGATLWNKLPLHVRLCPNLFNFKQLVKTHILNAK